MTDIKIEININTDNSAFEDNDSELNRILGNYISNGINEMCKGDYMNFFLKDSNGNKVGSMEVEIN